MHFLRSSSVCVLRYIFRCAHFKRLYIDINGIALYRIAYKEYIDISYKLDIPPSPTVQTDTNTHMLRNTYLTSRLPGLALNLIGNGHTHNESSFLESKKAD